MEVLETAYNDAEGVTAAFNFNLLTRINEELGGDFDLDRFRHRAFYNPDLNRIEMHLESVTDQTVTIAGDRYTFAAGETVHTESSHKYTEPQFAQLAAAAGMRVVQVWKDDDALFSVQFLETI